MAINKKQPPLTLEQRVDPTCTALILVDVQNDFVSTDGACAAAGADVSAGPPMVERLKVLVESARKAGVLIIYIQTIFDEPMLSPAFAEVYYRLGFENRLARSDSPGSNFYEGIGPNGTPNEIVIRKHRFSAFWGTELDLILRANGIRTLVMTGIATEVCVESTARDGFFSDYVIVEAEDCVSSLSEDRHRASQVVIQRIFGSVIPSADIRAVWDASSQGGRNWQASQKASRQLKTLRQRLSPAHTALVLIDMQNEFCHEKDADLSAIQSAVEKTRKLVAEARKSGCQIIHVRTEYKEQSTHVGSPIRYKSTAAPDGIVHTLSAADLDTDAGGAIEPAKLCEPGTHGHAFVDGFGPEQDDLVVTKYRLSGFADTPLELLLRSNGVRTVVIAGIGTNGAVESTVREAATKDFYVVVAEDGVATKATSAALHEASLETIRAYFGRVEPIARIADAWRSENAL